MNASEGTPLTDALEAECAGWDKLRWVTQAVVKKLFKHARDLERKLRTAEADLSALMVERDRALERAARWNGCCCSFEEDGETQTRWCSIHALLRERAETAEAALTERTPEGYITAYDNALDALCKALEDSISSNEYDTIPPIIGQYAKRLNEAAADQKEVLLIARRVIGSIGSFDPKLQDYYQQMLDRALNLSQPEKGDKSSTG